MGYGDGVLQVISVPVCNPLPILLLVTLTKLIWFTKLCFDGMNTPTPRMSRYMYFITLGKKTYDIINRDLMRF